MKMAENPNSGKGKSVPTSGNPKEGGFREQYVDFTPEMSEKGSESHRFPVQSEKWENQERAKRLRQAVNEAGGNRAVSTRSGVAYGTLNDYLAGGEMKVGRAVALAEATGVTLEWLLTGRGPMRAGQAAPAVPAGPPVHRLPVDLDALDIENLAWALGFAEKLSGRNHPVAQRVEAMLSAAAEFRRANRMPPLPPMDLNALADSLQLVEQLELLPRSLGRPFSDRLRVRRMLGAYALLTEIDDENPQ